MTPTVVRRKPDFPEPTTSAPRVWRPAILALACSAILIGLSREWGLHLLERGQRIGIGAPPLAGRFARVGMTRALPAGLVAALVVFGRRFTRSWSWRAVLTCVFLVSGAWAVALARVDGIQALVGPLRRGQYFQTAHGIHGVGDFLTHFVDWITSYSVHTQGHPPGMSLVLWLMDRLGLGSLRWNAALVVAGGAAAGVAALVALREVAGEASARVAAPFVVLAPAAIWWSSGDAFFAGVSAWAVTFVVLATGRDGKDADRLALFGGLLFGITAFLSYGLILLAVIPIAVAVARRRIRPLVLAAIGATPVFVAFRVAGFSWIAGLEATRTRYFAGIARTRPYSYFLVANLAAFVCALGPAAAVALAWLRDNRVWLLVGGAFTVVALADLSGMSKAEVERIWLPFVPWVMLATAAFATRRSRETSWWLGLQAAGAVVIELTVRSPW